MSTCDGACPASSDCPACWENLPPDPAEHRADRADTAALAVALTRTGRARTPGAAPDEAPADG